MSQNGQKVHSETSPMDMKGVIIENIANLYQVECKENDENQVYEAVARGRFKKEEITPVVGDFVDFEITDKENKKAVINEILERKVYIKRPKLANVTQLVLVLASKDPKPDLLMLDKQLAFAEFLGIKACIVLNKTDLDQKEEFKKIKRIYENIGYQVITTDAKSQKGMEELKQALNHQVNAFSGNSGVGKSTLINGIFKRDITQEGEISKKNKRGKNTTTATKLYEIDQDTYIADTPGFSTFSIEEIESKKLANYFKEFIPWMSQCEFIGCTHIKEENCGIKEAIKVGKISQERYERFCKIYEELKQKEERKKW